MKKIIIILLVLMSLTSCYRRVGTFTNGNEKIWLDYAGLGYYQIVILEGDNYIIIKYFNTSDDKTNIYKVLIEDDNIKMTYKDELLERVIDKYTKIRDDALDEMIF